MGLVTRSISDFERWRKAVLRGLETCKRLLGRSHAKMMVWLRERSQGGASTEKDQEDRSARKAPWEPTLDGKEAKAAHE